MCHTSKVWHILTLKQRFNPVGHTLQHLRGKGFFQLCVFLWGTGNTMLVEMVEAGYYPGFV